jgi:hypothetical protein
MHMTGEWLLGFETLQYHLQNHTVCTGNHQSEYDLTVCYLCLTSIIVMHNLAAGRAK